MNNLTIHERDGALWTDSRERRVLELMYIHPQKGALETLMEELGVEKTQVYRIKDRAISKYTAAMYGLPQL